MTDTMFDAGKNARRETNAIKGWIEEKLPFWDEVIDVDYELNLVQISRFPGKWSPVFNRILPEIGGYVLVLRVAEEFIVMGPPPEEETQVQTAPEDPIDAEEGQIYKIVNEDGTFIIVSVVETETGREYREIGTKVAQWNNQYVAHFGEEGTGPGQFGDEVRDIAVFNWPGDGTDHLIVSSDDRVQEFLLDGTFVKTLTTPGSGTGLGVAETLAPSGLSGYWSPVIADTGNNRVGIYQHFGETFDTFYGPDPEDPEQIPLSAPGDFVRIMAGDDETYTYVWWLIADTGNDRIWIQGYKEVVAPSGPPYYVEYAQEVPLQAGLEPLVSPSRIFVISNPPNLRIAVVEKTLNRIRFFSLVDPPYTSDISMYQYLVIDGGGDSSVPLINPTDVALDEDENVYVSNTGLNRVNVYNRNGVFVGAFGGRGSDEGKFIRPTGITILRDHVYVCDSGNHRVQIFTNPVQSDTSTPAGTIVGWAGIAEPRGWMLCDGRELSRLNYPKLYEAIGDSYGSSGSPYFNLPDLRGRVPAGRSYTQAEFAFLGQLGGTVNHILTANQTGLRSHAHVGDGGATVVGRTAGNPNTGSAAAGLTSTAGPLDAAEAHNNLQPYQVINYIIKY